MLLVFFRAKSTVVVLDPKSVVPSNRVRLSHKEFHRVATHGRLKSDDSFLADGTVPMMQRIVYIARTAGPSLQTLEPYRSILTILLADLTLLWSAYVLWEADLRGAPAVVFSLMFGFTAGGCAGFATGWFYRWIRAYL